ncbi:sulfur oxidation c-type cytochrome SoxX [Ostreiculturibacter nitratireducens]|uniref:sulfur oxidation c-type cytochrome SoxX n=1 Tax=Ostreiculturibacter nitratireducens TaxID=3075226 RepID=UPI0031B64D7B
MKRHIMIGVTVSVIAATAAQGEMAPGDVVFDVGAVAESLTGTPGNPEEGAKVMSNRGLGNCVACHAVSAMPDVPFQGNIGPTLDGVADRWDEAALRGIVANAKMTYEGTIMPAFYKNEGYIRPGDAFTGKAAPAEGLPPLLTAQQVEDVVAYLLTLKE